MIQLNTVNKALKEVYLGVLSDMLNNKTDVLLGKIQQTSSDVYGAEIYKTIYLNGEQITLHEKLENLYAEIEISDKAIRCCENSTGALVNLLNDEIECLVKDTQRKLCSAFYTEDIKPEVFPKEYEYKPLKVTGLKKIFDINSKELYGINRQDRPGINPTIETIEKFDPIKVQEIIDNNNDNIDVIVCSSKVKREYMEYLSKHRQNVEIEEIYGGYKCIRFNNSILMVVAKIPDDELFLLNTEDFKFHQLCDWEWLEDENGNIFRQVVGKPVYKATLVKYGNYICKNPHGQIKIILKN